MELRIRTRVFKDTNVLNEMLFLRRQGWTYQELADRYKVDKSSISHWCRAYGLDGEVIDIVREFYKQMHIELNRPRRVIVFVKIDPIWRDDPIEGKINLGKSYRDYLKQSA